MRRFHSYGPVDPELHFCVPRAALVEDCVNQLIGPPGKAGYYFTIWAARQAGKTWLMRRAVEEIRRRYSDRFLVATISMQGVSIKQDQPAELFFSRVPRLFQRYLGLSVNQPHSWEEWGSLFIKGTAPFERPLILLIDEFDRLPPAVIDELVAQFRDLHLDRDVNLLHGLALIGVRAVLGVESDRGSPFNVQRSLRVPNLTRAEVGDMFQQYQTESGQTVVPQVIDTLYDLVRGQPGLIGWFGELLTERYHPGPGRPITMEVWSRVYAAACQVEPNNTLLNLLKKARGRYLPQLIQIFNRTDVPFSSGQDWCNYLWLNGIIEPQETVDRSGAAVHVCRFSSPFVQQRLFHDLQHEVLDEERELPLLPLDTLSDVFVEGCGVAAPLLLDRYVAYLGRLAKKGESPWQGQPRRKDLHHTEAVGHFHLYSWLQTAVGKRCVVSPEFPTGNGAVDLVLTWGSHRAIIEVKSFVDYYELGLGQEQAARYAARLGLPDATLAVFIPVDDPDVLAQLSRPRDIGAVRVNTVTIPWSHHPHRGG